MNVGLLNSRLALALVVPLALVLVGFAPAFGLPVDLPTVGSHRMRSMVGAALLVAGWAYAGGLLRREGILGSHPSEASWSRHWPSWVWTLVWVMLWALVWSVWPPLGFFKWAGALGFFGLVWLRAEEELPFDAPRSCFRVLMPAALLGLAVGLVVLVLSSPFRDERLLSDWTGPLLLDGRHFQHGVLLDWISQLQLLGPAPGASVPARGHLPGVQLVELSAQGGLLSGVLGAGLVLLLCLGAAVGAWRSVPSSSVDRRWHAVFGALVTVHAVGGALWVAWNLGFTRQPLTGGAPLVGETWSWGVLNLSTLAMAVVLARRQGVRWAGRRLDLRTVTAGCALWGAASVALLAWVDHVRVTHRMSLWAHSSVSRVPRAIVDRTGATLAETITAYDVIVVPRDFWGLSAANPKAASASSAPSLSDEARLTRLMQALDGWPEAQEVARGRLWRFRKDDAQPKVLAWAVPGAAAERLKQAALGGLRIEARPSRHYPAGASFAHAVGFAGRSDATQGQEGLERKEHRRLVQPGGSAGSDQALWTTLDPKLQTIARDHLMAAKSWQGADGAALVAIHVPTGEVRAMVSLPDFDPNEPASFRNPWQPERIRNRATALPVPMGALLTPLVVAQGLESGRIDPDDTVNVGRGTLKVGNVTIRDRNREAELSIDEVVAKSSNVGLAKLVLQMPPLELGGMASHLGLGRPLDIPGVIGAAVEPEVPYEQWAAQDLANAGTLIRATLMQILKAYMPIASGGLTRPIRMLAGPSAPGSAQRVMSEETAAKLREILGMAVGPEGTAPLPKGPAGRDLAGKTSTVRAAILVGDEAGSTQSADVATFIGMAPAENPEWLIGTMLQFDEGKGRYAGGSTLAQVVADVIRAADSDGNR